MTVKELYTVCNNLYDNTRVEIVDASGNFDCVYMRDLLIRHENNEVKWFNLLQNGMCMIELRYDSKRL